MAEDKEKKNNFLFYIFVIFVFIGILIVLATIILYNTLGATWYVWTLLSIGGILTLVGSISLIVFSLNL